LSKVFTETDVAALAVVVVVASGMPVPTSRAAAKAMERVRRCKGGVPIESAGAKRY